MPFLDDPSNRIQFLGFSLEAKKLLYPWGNSPRHSQIDPARKEQELLFSRSQYSQPTYTGLSERQVNISTLSKDSKPYKGISIVNLDKEKYDKGLEVISLPFVPSEISVNPEASYVAVKLIGRNTYDYHYLGSEDTLEFEIDWFSMSGDPNYVIDNCRKVEALSKSDGFKNPPPRVRIVWGTENTLFNGRVFHVLKAPYTLTNFKVGYYDPNDNYVNTYMLPHQATQTVTLARISTTSLTHANILK